ncbi:hypothetical protein D3C73_1043190 [compost metagenome]
MPGEHGGADEAVEIGIERTGKSSYHRRDDEAGQPDTIGMNTDGRDTCLVLPCRLQGRAETRGADQGEQCNADEQHDITDEEEAQRLHRIDAGKLVAHQDRQPVLAAIGGP